jgi:tripartite-type tricarboxylate transporter receptor subunit TctC
MLKIGVCFFFVLTFFAVNSAYSQGTKSEEFPSRPVTIIVPWPAGTSADLAFRLYAKVGEKYLGQPMVVVNKTGGGGTIALAAIATAKPDGYTVGQSPGAGAQFILPFLEKVPYHPVKDFRQIMQFCILNTGVVVKADSPFKSLKDLIDFARQNPKKLTYGTNAPNSIGNLIMEQVAKKEGVQFTHIPFKGATEYQTALLGGHVHFTAGDFKYTLVDSGEIRILFYLGEKRSDDYPQVPILKELGHDIPCPVFMGIMGPRGIPEEITKKLEKAFTDTMKEPEFLKGMKDLHVTVFYRNSRQFEDYIANTYDKFEKLLREKGLLK